MKENENEIECIERKYRVKMPGGLIVEVESTKPLSVQMTHELLEEDNEIDSFFTHHKIMNMRQVVASPIKDTHGTIIGGKVGPKKGIFTPMQRLNNMLKMTGEFTRKDYQKHMLDMYNVNVPRHMSHDDINRAIKSKRIELIAGKMGSPGKYRVVDPVDIDENLYKSLLAGRKIQMEAMR